MTHHTPVQVRFVDTDALGHLNNTAYAVYAELARLEFLRETATEVSSLILAHLAIDFRKQVRFQDEVGVATWVEKVGTSSVTLYQEVYAAGEPAAEIRSVVVHFDYAAQRSTPLPEAVRASLLTHTRHPAASEA